MRLGGLGIADPTTLSSPYYKASQLVTRSLVSLIVSQEANQSVNLEITKNNVRALNRSRHAQQANNVKDQLPEALKHQVELASEKGASSWLSVLPIGEHGFHLHKGEFRPSGMLYV